MAHLQPTSTINIPQARYKSTNFLYCLILFSIFILRIFIKYYFSYFNEVKSASSYFLRVNWL